jgi:hypothetical protein
MDCVIVGGQQRCRSISSLLKSSLWAPCNLLLPKGCLIGGKCRRLVLLTIMYVMRSFCSINKYSISLGCKTVWRNLLDA